MLLGAPSQSGPSATTRVQLRPATRFVDTGPCADRACTRIGASAPRVRPRWCRCGCGRERARAGGSTGSGRRSSGSRGVPSVGTFAADVQGEGAVGGRRRGRGRRSFGEGPAPRDPHGASAGRHDDVADSGEVACQHVRVLPVDPGARIHVVDVGPARLGRGVVETPERGEGPGRRVRATPATRARRRAKDAAPRPPDRDARPRGRPARGRTVRCRTESTPRRCRRPRPGGRIGHGGGPSHDVVRLWPCWAGPGKAWAECRVTGREARGPGESGTRNAPDPVGGTGAGVSAGVRGVPCPRPR